MIKNERAYWMSKPKKQKQNVEMVPYRQKIITTSV